MFRYAAALQELVDCAIELYRDSALCRAICMNLLFLAGLMSLDGLAGFPTGTRMAYVLPIWLATKRGGRHAGATLVLVTTFLLVLVDSAKGGRNSSMLVNCAMQTAVLYLLMLIFDRVESELRTVTKLATRDPLTGLFSRMEIEDRGRRAADRGVVSEHPLSIAMIDCDRFKELNDTFGHAFGDEVLRLLSKAMKRCLGSDAIIGRAGGDEFIVILPNRDRLAALSQLEATLDRFMSNTEVIGRSAGFSYGIAVLGEDGYDYDRLLRAADEDMYRRKANRSEKVRPLAS
jgi:diguanylate cyclase (GGDEF)-like protein